MLAFTDRARRWLDASLADRITDLCLVVVGCGGTGWTLAQQLAALGPKRIVLVDGDRIEASNLARLPGAQAGNAGLPKAEVLATVLANSGFPGTIRTLVSHVPSPAFLSSVQEADVVFAAADNPYARLAASLIARACNLVFIDTGVSAEVRGGRVGGGAQARLFRPSGPCVVCSGLSLEERGYLADSPGVPQGAWLGLNQIAASLAVIIWLGEMQASSSPDVIDFDLFTVSMTSSRIGYQEGCPVCSEKLTPKYFTAAEEFVANLCSDDP